MLRGWIKSDRRKPALPVIAALIAAGIALMHHDAQAQPLTNDMFETHIVGHRFAAEPFEFDVSASYLADGRIEIKSTLGFFEGKWSQLGSQICVYFETGPRQGQNCAEVARLADGRFKTSTGVILTPLGPV